MAGMEEDASGGDVAAAEVAAPPSWFEQVAAAAAAVHSSMEAPLASWKAGEPAVILHSHGRTLAAAVEQRPSGGDRWHRLAEVRLLSVDAAEPNPSSPAVVQRSVNFLQGRRVRHSLVARFDWRRRIRTAESGLAEAAAVAAVAAVEAAGP